MWYKAQSYLDTIKRKLKFEVTQRQKQMKLNNYTKKQIEEKELEWTFGSFDMDKSNSIDRFLVAVSQILLHLILEQLHCSTELRLLFQDLCIPCTDKQLEDTLHELDADGNGEIDVRAFNF